MLKDYQNALKQEFVRIAKLKKFDKETNDFINTCQDITLSCVAGNGYFEVVKHLVRQGLKIDFGAVNNALNNKHFEIARYLAEHGGYINENAIVWAAEKNNFEMVKLLVQCGGKIDEDAVAWAAAKNNFEMVKFLIEHGASINEDAVENVLIENNFEMVVFLIKHGGKIEDYFVQFAVARNYFEIAKFLVEHGGKINDVSVKNAAAKGSFEMVKFLIEHGGKINDEAMGTSVAKGNLEMVKFLIEYGGKINDDMVKTAAAKGNLEMIKFLIEHGGKINNALENATANGHLEIIKYFVTQGIKISEEILIKAAESNDRETIKYIIETIAEPKNINLKDGKLLFLLSGNDEMLKLILETVKVSAYELYQISKNAFLKGNYDLAAKLHGMLDKCFKSNLRADVESAIIKGLKASVENNKHHAIVNLIDKAGIKISDKYSHLINNIKDDIEPNEFNFIYGLTHRLAQHYINLSKTSLEKNLMPEAIDPEVKKILSKAFVIDNQERLENFELLKQIFPDNKELYKVKNEFDAYYMVVGKALNQLDKDFALEVLALNGIGVPALEEPVRVYRGFVANMDEGNIDGFFKYGTRAFGKGEMQKTLGYHVREAWNMVDNGNTYVWQYGATYVSLEPSVSAMFANGFMASIKGENILLEARLEAGSVKVCGHNTHEYELAPSGIEADEIIAIYKLEENTVKSVYKNPYLQDSSLIPRFKINDTVTQDINAIEKYNSLGCEIIKYENYEDFLAKYNHLPEMLMPYFEGRIFYNETLFE
ncbi:ankyrin repeat-containing protein [endosymbiont of Acanthamoeba sp. UWC8]|uniref:ankyrin repeat domain-containing protein n=1 Tax=endosymbiont of Acanthamoeba sp. UWC8 TaxID=86106 RepID=UPI0004D14D5B|nr:ankyrin repeat domain-containing protein [endosymbiont of Acanthamoeba sp. UWC8]AIF81942.1 ankyrin repeat-containing protein [endosymbiont of Acanthamoeba sp. UWC8]